jgi:Domain of unknown function (DUF4139)/N-terminal domain of unknown function (DUF4140)
MLAFVVVGWVVAAEAPITQVTVYSDQARVVRSTTLAIAGEQTIELATLPSTVDVGSIRVEVTGAELRRALLERVARAQLTTDVAELERLETEVDRLTRQRSSLERQRDALLAISASTPEAELTPKLNAAGWLAGQGFLAQRTEALQARVRETATLLEQTAHARSSALERAHRLNAKPQQPGLRVSAIVSGIGLATVRCSYLMPQARWTPAWDLQLAPDQDVVTLSLTGVVRQETTEAWNDVALELSTAMPSSAVKAPELVRWTIGAVDRFIPTPRPVVTKRAPPAPQQAPPPEDEPPHRAAPREAKPTERASSVLTGTVTDLDSRRPITDVVATAKSPGHQDEVVVTDSAGNFRFPLEPGTYSVVLEHEDYRAFERPDVKVRADRTVRFNASLQRKDSTSEVTTVDGLDFINNIAFIQPNSSGVRAFESLASTARSEPPTHDVEVSLSPPPSWSPPRPPADDAELTFSASNQERLPSSNAERRVPLWAGQWPVTLERHLYPALSSSAYLVAQLRNPTQRLLPGGRARLMVGADPAGEAQLAMLVPGEALTLPLGVDKALQPIRTVRLVEATAGFFRNATRGTYSVTIELANPHPMPVAVRVFDQWPLAAKAGVETHLLETTPTAKRDDTTGWLDWSATIPAGGKAQFSYSYTISRPEGWRLAGTEVAP